MAYTKQNFKNGDVLTAEKLNAMEDGIEEAVTLAEEAKTLSGDTSFTYGTEDLVAGTSELETGKVYFVIE